MKFELNIPSENYDDFLLIAKLLQDLIHFKANKIEIGYEIKIDYSPKPQVQVDGDCGQEKTFCHITTPIPVADKPKTSRTPREITIKLKKKRGIRTGLQKDFKGFNIRCKRCGQGKPQSEYKGTWRICKSCRTRGKKK